MCCLPNHEWSGQCSRTTLTLYEHREIYNNIQCCIVTCIRSHSTFENKLNKKKRKMKKKQTHDQGHHFQTKLLKTVFIIYFKTSNTTMCIKTHMVRSKVFCVDIPMMEFVHCILHARWFRCLLLCLCLIFSALINFLSLCCSKLSNQETIYCLKEKKEKKRAYLGF